MGKKLKWNGEESAFKTKAEIRGKWWTFHLTPLSSFFLNLLRAPCYLVTVSSVTSCLWSVSLLQGVFINLNISFESLSSQLFKHSLSWVKSEISSSSLASFSIELFELGETRKLFTKINIFKWKISKISLNNISRGFMAGCDFCNFFLDFKFSTNFNFSAQADKHFILVINLLGFFVDCNIAFLEVECWLTKSQLFQKTRRRRDKAVSVVPPPTSAGLSWH